MAVHLPFVFFSSYYCFRRCHCCCCSCIDSSCNKDDDNNTVEMTKMTQVMVVVVISPSFPTKSNYIKSKWWWFHDYNTDPFLYIQLLPPELTFDDAFIFFARFWFVSFNFFVCFSHFSPLIFYTWKYFFNETTDL